MDESHHPNTAHSEQVDTRQNADGTSVPGNVDNATSEVTDAQSSLKRPHDEPASDESPAKRANIEETSQEPETNAEIPDDDLDLDAIMAQLQQHTEKSSAKKDDEPSPPKETTETNAETNNSESELSIEQQLKGALSSLELEAGELDLGIDQLSQILKGNDSDAQKPEGDGKAAQVSTEGDANTKEGLHTEEQKSGDSAPKEVGKQESSISSRRESLISQMPPPPAHLHGKLPPMPPPPPAFTSPIASTLPVLKESGGSSDLTITQRHDRIHAAALSSSLASSRSHYGGHDGTDAGSSVLSTLHRVPASIPHETEPPAPLSESYERILLEQVEEVNKKKSSQTESTDEQKKDGADSSKEKEDGATKDTEDRSQTAQSSSPENLPTPIYLNDNNAILNARRRSILLLDSLAYQLLEILSCSHYQETLATVMQPESERGMIYRIALDAFEDVKRIYMKWETASSRIKPEPKPAESRPFLPYNIPGVEPSRDNITTIQRVNVVTFVAALFGSIEIGFWELDESFIKVFVPETGRLLKQQANIYLDLKTQAYISAVEATDDKEAHKKALEHLFPADLESKMQFMLGVRTHLAPQEKDFIAKCQRRRDNILSEDPADLPKKYHWVPFLREVCDYISKNHNTLLPPRKRTVLLPDNDTPGSYERGSSVQTPRNYPSQRRQAPSAHARSSIPPSASPSPAQSRRTSAAHVVGSSTAADVDKSAAASRADGQNDTRNGDDAKKSGSDEVKVTDVKSSKGPHPKMEIPESHTSGDKIIEEARGMSKLGLEKANIPSEGHPMFPPLPKQVLPPPSLKPNSPPPPVKTKPDPPIDFSPGNTLAAYEAAKASAEGTDAIRPKSSLFTTRRTWTKQEEEALLKGMDKVQGPYWSQILELYGPGGKISEVLKDRTQVQLKDKARNLKMFFVRLGLPIPAVFQYVTGDYESRKSSGRKVKEKRAQSMRPEQKPPIHRAPPPPHPVASTIPTHPAPQPNAHAFNADQTLLKAGPSTVSFNANAPGNPSVAENPRTAENRVLPTASFPTETHSGTPGGTVSPTNSSQINKEPVKAENSEVKNNSDASHIEKSAQDKELIGDKTGEQTAAVAGPSTKDNVASAQQNNTVTVTETRSTACETTIVVEHKEYDQKTESTVETTNEFSGVLDDSNDKDDLNSLLDRMGKYVENH